MDTETTYRRLKNIALVEFPDIVVEAFILRGHLNTPKSLRLFFTDGSFLEVWLSNEKYSYHWQGKDGSIYRHDNAPHKKDKHINTFPKHFHNGREDKVEESHINNKPTSAIREILELIRTKL